MYTSHPHLARSSRIADTAQACNETMRKLGLICSAHHVQWSITLLEVQLCDLQSRMLVLVLSEQLGGGDCWRLVQCAGIENLLCFELLFLIPYFVLQLLIQSDNPLDFLVRYRQHAFNYTMRLNAARMLLLLFSCFDTSKYQIVKSLEQLNILLCCIVWSMIAIYRITCYTRVPDVYTESPSCSRLNYVFKHDKVSHQFSRL